MTERYICIHGHFYQPPRENAWLEAVETQDSAYPYHDWNAKITAECYAANAASRILDDQGRIVQIVNNYNRMSFNFGPTLLAWLQTHAADVYRAILDADAESVQRFSGHGSALAQAYNHMILPLADRRDKYTQVLWGIRDFEHRFGRRPEGLWLPETAVDTETLDVLAELGILFTILSPYQAGKVRSDGQEQWHDVGAGTIDPTKPYIQHLPSGRSITLFFYDGPISRAVAFERLLKNGDGFAKRLLSGFSDKAGSPQLVHIATDGESYGHHHPHGDMALAYALRYIETKGSARLTNYGEYLAKYPPVDEVQIVEGSSWSCSHGVERWRSDCGCSSGRHPNWNQGWREPLREALDWLRDTLAPVYTEKMGVYLKDPWQARNDYIDALLDRSVENLEQLLSRHAHQTLSHLDKMKLLKLLEMQRHLMLMYTSCGWFFDELSGIETVQIIQFAGRAIQLSDEIMGTDIESQFLKRLENAVSNIPGHANGRRIYERFVKPAMVDLRKVAVHYAICSLFEDYSDQTPVYCYCADRRDYHSAKAGKANLAVGRVAITSAITQETAGFHFAVLHFGDHNVTCGLMEYLDRPSHQKMKKDIFAAFDKADFPEILRMLNTYFGASMYSLKSLFRDEQRKILNVVLATALSEALSAYHHIYEHHVPLMRFLKDAGSLPPRALYAAGEFYVNSQLQQAFSQGELDYKSIRNLLEEANLSGISLDADTLEFTLREQLEQIAESFKSAPENIELLEILVTGVNLVYSLPFDVNLRKAQNIHYDLGRRIYPVFRQKSADGDAQAGRWVELFDELSEKLLIRFE
jgi:alpha-amylase/alpha-mannosidase (GH57 family)